MSKSLRKLQSLGDSTITTRQRERARKLAGAGHNADHIASVVGISADHAEEIVTTVNEDRSKVDPQLIWARDRDRMNLSNPTKELFVQLFKDHRAATHDNQRAAIRERIILEATNLVRRYVAEHVAQHKARWKFEDLESVCTISVITEADRLLAKDLAHDNPGSMIIFAIRDAIYDPDRDYLSTPHIIADNRRDEHGKQHGGKHKRVESSWPRGAKSRDEDKMLTGERDGWQPGEQIQGQRHNGRPMSTVETVARSADDDWQTLAELCDDEEMFLLDMLAQGYTRDEAAREMNCHVSTITKRLNKIKAKVQSHEDD